MVYLNIDLFNLLSET